VPQVTDKTWRDDISGLRGLAFLLVLFYHLDSSILPSGFLGVDLFFVISGFLITRAVQEEMTQDQSFSIANFIARRAKRLLPTAALVAVVVVILNRWFLEPTRRAGAISDAIRAVTFRTNIEFHARAENYFYTSSQESIFRHYWSLSLEEQYYILFPLVAYIGWRARGVLGLKIALTLIFIGSLSASLYVANDAGFYLMPFRAWQMAAGGLIALPLTARRNASTAAQVGAFFSLLVLIAACFTTLADRNAERVVVTFSGCALIYLMSRDSLLGKALSLLKRTGERSFSLYLWHWPFILYAKNTNRWGQDGLLIRLSIAVLATFIAAEVTYRFVESLRWKPLFSQPNKAIALGVASSVAALSFLLPQTGASVSRNETTGPNVTNVLEKQIEADVGPVAPGLPSSARSSYVCSGYTTPTGCVVGDEDSPTRILLIGDTNTWAEMFSDLVIQENWLLETYSNMNNAGALSTRHPSLVVYALPEQTLESVALVEKIGGLITEQKVPSLFLTHPSLGLGPDCLEAATTYEECDSPVPDNSAFSEISRSIKNSSFVETNSWFCQKTCPSSLNGIVLATLDGSMSLQGQSLVRPALLDILKSYATDALPTIDQASSQKTLPSKLVVSIEEIVKEGPRSPVCGANSALGDECMSFIDPDLPLVVLIGDSHAGQWADVISHVARTRFYQTLMFPGCDEQCSEFEGRLVTILQTLTPEVIITSGKLYTPLYEYEKNSMVESWLARQKSFMELLSPYAKSWLVIGDTPELILHVPDCLSQNKEDITRCGQTRELSTSRPFQTAEKKLVEELARVRSKNITYVDPTQWLCGEWCPPVRGGLILYRDDNHISISASYAYTTKIRAALDPLLGR